MADLSTTIETVAGQPSFVSGDAGQVTTQPLTSLIAADQYLAARNGSRTKLGGMRITKLVPPGPVMDSTSDTV